MSKDITGNSVSRRFWIDTYVPPFGLATAIYFASASLLFIELLPSLFVGFPATGQVEPWTVLHLIGKHCLPATAQASQWFGEQRLCRHVMATVIIAMAVYGSFSRSKAAHTAMVVAALIPLLSAAFNLYALYDVLTGCL